MKPCLRVQFSLRPILVLGIDISSLLVPGRVDHRRCFGCLGAISRDRLEHRARRVPNRCRRSPRRRRCVRPVVASRGLARCAHRGHGSANTSHRLRHPGCLGNGGNASGRHRCTPRRSARLGGGHHPAPVRRDPPLGAGGCRVSTLRRELHHRPSGSKHDARVCRAAWARGRPVIGERFEQAGSVSS